MAELDLEKLIADAISKAFSNNNKGNANVSMKFHTEPIEGSTLVEADCPACGHHGLVEPKVVEKTVEKEITKEVAPKGWINPNEANFKTLAPILEKHHSDDPNNPNSLFTCPNCETDAWNWFINQKGFDDWIKKHGYKMVKR